MAVDLRNFYQALDDRVLDPDQPADEKVYVKDLHRHGDSVDLLDVLANRIEWDNGGGSYLFTGQRGTGKTTELRRLARRLSGRSCSVVYVDISEHLNLTSPVNLSDFLITVFGAVAEKVKQEYQLDVIADSFWKRLSEFLHTQVKFEQLTFEGELGGFKAELQGALKTDPDFKRRLQEKVRGHTARLVEESQRFAREVSQTVRQKEKTARFVLIVDSLEQTRGVGLNNEEVFASVNELFQQSDKLHFEGLHAVYAIPPYLLAMAGSLGAYYSGGMIYALYGVHLFKDCSRDISPEGLAKMIEIVAQRCPGWEAVIDRADLEKVALASGGDIRDYLRMIRFCLAELHVRRLQKKPAERITAELVEGAKNQLLRDMLPIAETDKKWLRDIAGTHRPCLPSPKDLPTLARFFESKFVLNYRNGQDWYDVHPLLREHIGAITQLAPQPA